MVWFPVNKQLTSSKILLWFTSRNWIFHKDKEINIGFGLRFCLFSALQHSDNIYFFFVVLLGKEYRETKIKEYFWKNPVFVVVLSQLITHNPNITMWFLMEIFWVTHFFNTKLWLLYCRKPNFRRNKSLYLSIYWQSSRKTMQITTYNLSSLIDSFMNQHMT